MEFSAVLADLEVEHVFVAGYVAIVTGRARSTEDIDVLIERLPPEEIESLVRELETASYWGPAMPLETMYESLADGANVWVPPDGQVTPHLEVKVPSNEFDRASLDGSIGGETIPVGPLELQIAYILYLGARRTSKTQPTFTPSSAIRLGEMRSKRGQRNSA